MKKYIVTETESNTPDYQYQEEFDAIEKAELYQNSVIVYLTDGNIIE